MLTVLVGGARSGKSALAVELGRRHAGPVTFVATMVPFDDDLAERRARHRGERPDWPTIEEPHDLAGALRGVTGLTIIDCLTLWVANLVQRGDGDEAIEAAADDAVTVVDERDEPTVVVTNEVGLGVHPETELGLRFRDLLGRVNQRFVCRADHALLLVGGRAARLEDPWALLA